MSSSRRFACTQCGKCCNRSPEVELSEAAALGRDFIFLLMFRFYHMARAPGREGTGNRELFYEKKRLLAAHAARKYPKKIVREGKAAEHIGYLMISALAMDSSPGACAVLVEGRCAIYERRPLGCRTVPLHYSRAEGLAERDFDAFVSTLDYGCDTSPGSALFLHDGRIMDAPTIQARTEALVIARQDRAWKEAIVRRMKSSRSSGALPSLEEVEANAPVAATTTSMRIGWEIAAEEGIISREACRLLFEQQLARIDAELDPSNPAADRQTLREMRADYQQALTVR